MRSAQAPPAGHAARLPRRRRRTARRDRGGRTQQPAHRSGSTRPPRRLLGLQLSARHRRARRSQRLQPLPLAHWLAAGPQRRAAGDAPRRVNPRATPQPAPDPVFRTTVAAGRARRQPAAAAGADAPRFRRQRLARAAHAADRGARLPGHAGPGRAPGLGADAGRDAAAVAAHDPTGRGPADPVAPGSAGQPAGRGAGGDGADAGHAAARGRGAQPGPPRRSRSRTTAGVDLCGSNKELHSAFSNLVSNAVRYTPAGGAITRAASRADARWRRRAGGARHRLRHSRRAPAAHHRTLLPRVHQPLARKRRHRPGPVHRQARAEPAPGPAGDRPAKSATAARSPATSAPNACSARDANASVPSRACHERCMPPWPRLRPARRPGDPLRDPALYLNRELSQLDFNFRVLAQAQDPQVPLLERLRFLCISCTNLDEFFEIRAGTRAPRAWISACRRPPTAWRRRPCSTRIHDRAAELVARAVRLLERGAAPGAGRGRRARAAARAWNAAADALAARLLPRRDHAGAVAAGPGSGASVPEDPQQVAQHRGRAEGQGCVRPRRPPGHRARAALAAAHHPAAASACPAASTISCSCRRCCRRSSTSCSRAWRSRAPTSSA